MQIHIELGEMRQFTGFILFVVWIMLNVAAVPFSQKIYEEMSVKEHAEIFPSPDGRIPDYEIVPIRWPRINKRDVQGVTTLKFNAFGEDIELWLHPTDGILAGPKTPIYLAQKTSNGTEIVKLKNAMRHVINKKYNKLIKETNRINQATTTDHQNERYPIGDLYQNASSQSSFAVNNFSNGQRRITGIIGSRNLAIRPIPEHLEKKVTKLRRSLDSIAKSEYEDLHYHIVYKIDSANLMKPLEDSLSSERSKRDVPDVIYPEILVVVDYDLLETFNNRVYDIVPYLLTFWNQVDMNFRSLRNPKFRLNIAGIVLAKDPHALEYMETHRFNDNEYISRIPLDDFGKWLYKHDQYIPVESYDIAITVTINRMCYGEDVTCLSQLSGQGYVAGACDIDREEKTMQKTSAAHIDAFYDGIETVSHELGHLLGADHDNDYTDILCRLEYGYIMSAMNHATDYSWDWSKCSLSNFTQFLNNNKSQCLYNKPDPGEPIHLLLPGQMMDANKQCQRIMKTNAYVIDETTCMSIKCLLRGSSTDYKNVNQAALEGTSCGNGKFCIRRQCVSTRGIHY